MARHSCCMVICSIFLLWCCACGLLEKVAGIRLHHSSGGAAQLWGETEEEAASRWRAQTIGRERTAWRRRWQRDGSDGEGGRQKLAIGGGGGCSPCDEVYVVRDEGETLQTISEKCHAPFILLDNPHVQDTDDISTGSVLLISSTHMPCSHL